MELANLASVALFLTAAPAQADVDWEQLGQSLGRPSTQEEGGIRRFGFPRTDLSVSIDGLELRPGSALGSWLAFKPLEGDRVMVTGDLVLTHEEVAPVTDRLSESGIEVTALHNYLLRAEPPPMYLHVHATGDAVEIAVALRACGRPRSSAGRARAGTS